MVSSGFYTYKPEHAELFFYQGDPLGPILETKDDTHYELFVAVGPAFITWKVPSSNTSAPSASSHGDILEVGATWALILRCVETDKATWYLTVSAGSDGHLRLVLDKKFPNTHFTEANAKKLGIINDGNDIKLFRKCCAEEEAKECRAFVLNIVNRLVENCLIETMTIGTVEELDKYTETAMLYNGDDYVVVGEEAVTGLMRSLRISCQSQESRQDC
ncbi:hypothetical protein BDV10DRAFT_183981 [Aspergillus recurvatus]